MLELSKIRPLSNNDLSLTFGFLKCDLKSKTWIILKYHTFVEIRGENAIWGNHTSAFCLPQRLQSKFFETYYQGFLMSGTIIFLEN